MAKIFISYRREDSQWPAHKLYDTIRPLVADPDNDVFIDVDNIPLGVNFSEHLDGKVKQCDYLLAVIGPHWLSVSNPATGQRRLDDPADFVRIEIAAALKRGIPVIPVLMDGAKLPAPLDLPDDLRELPMRNGVEVRHLSFEHDVERLLAGVGLRTQPVAPVPKPESAVRTEPKARRFTVMPKPVAQKQSTSGKGPMLAVGGLVTLAATLGAGWILTMLPKSEGGVTNTNVEQSRVEVPVLLLSSEILPPGSPEPKITHLMDGYFVTYHFPNFNLTIRGAQKSEVGSPIEGLDSFSMESGEGRISIERFGAEYLLVFQCRDGKLLCLPPDALTDILGSLSESAR